MTVEVRDLNGGKVLPVDRRAERIFDTTAELRRKANLFIGRFAYECLSGKKTTSGDRNLALMIKHVDLDDGALNDQINRLTDRLNNLNDTNGIERKKTENEISSLRQVVGLRNYRVR